MQLTDFLFFVYLVFIFYQDYKYRAISWMLFPFGFLLFAFESFKYGSLYGQITLFLINFAICLLVYLVLLVYFSIKNKKVTNIIDTYIGMGDLLFILIISVGFSPINFILFINISLLAVLCIYLVLSGLLKFNKDKIPFAGMLAIFYLIYFILNRFWLNLNPYVDLNFISDL